MHDEISKTAFETALPIEQKLSYVMGYYGMDIVPVRLAPSQMYFAILKGMLIAVDKGDEFLEDLSEHQEDIEEYRCKILEKTGETAYEQGTEDRRAGRKAKYDISEILILAANFNDRDRKMLDRLLSDERQKLLDLFFDGDVEAYVKARKEAEIERQAWVDAGKPEMGIIDMSSAEQIITSIRKHMAMAIKSYVESGLHPHNLGVDIKHLHTGYVIASAAVKKRSPE